MTTITPQDASRRVLEFAHDNRLVQGSWHTEQDGRQLACMLGAMGNGIVIDAADKCPAELMPAWLAHLVVELFDGQPRDSAIAWAVRFATQMGHARWPAIDWEHVRVEFMVGTIDQALESARPSCGTEPYWPAVEAACRQVQQALRGNGDLAAARAARAAAEAARAAAGAAAEAAAWAAAGAAAWAAQASRLCDLIDQQLT